MKKLLIISFLLIVGGYGFGQEVSQKDIVSMEIFAVSFKNKAYSHSEKSIREQSNKKDGFYVFNKRFKNNKKASQIIKHFKELEQCDYTGLIYPNIIIDFYFSDGHKKTLILGSLQNTKFNGVIYKQNINLTKTLLNLLPTRLKRNVKVLNPIDKFCN